MNNNLRLYVMIAESSLAKSIYNDLSENYAEIDQLGIDYIV